MIWNLIVVTAISLVPWPLTANAVEYHRSVSPTLRAQLVEDLQFLQEVQLENQGSEFYQKLFQPAGVRPWFEARVRRIATDGCGGSPSVMACVFPIMPQWLYITPNYSRLKIPQVMRTSILLHEARHNDGESVWAHENCPVPFLDIEGEEIRGYYSGQPMAGLPACDKSIWGSYGVQLIWLQNIADACHNCNEKLRLDARILAADTFKRMIGNETRRALKNDLKFSQALLRSKFNAPQPKKNLSDAAKRRLLDDLLSRGLENDPRLDQHFSNLSPELRRGFVRQLLQLPAAHITSKSILAFILTRDAKTSAELEFVTKLPTELYLDRLIQQAALENRNLKEVPAWIFKTF